MFLNGENNPVVYNKILSHNQIMSNYVIVLQNFDYFSKSKILQLPKKPHHLKCCKCFCTFSKLVKECTPDRQIQNSPIITWKGGHSNNLCRYKILMLPFHWKNMSLGNLPKVCLSKVYLVNQMTFEQKYLSHGEGD